MKIANAFLTTIISVVGAGLLCVVLVYAAAVIWFHGDIEAVWDTVWVFKVEHTDTSVSREMEKTRRLMNHDDRE